MPDFLRIADIATTKTLFFDPDFEERCFAFCKQRDIEFLPSLENPSEIYVRDDSAKSFRVEKIDQQQKIVGYQNAFQPKVLDLFRKNHLLFVYSEDELYGVVHFSDFNKSVVSAYLFEVFFRYERTLRILLQECDLGNSDIAKHFEHKAATCKRETSRSFYQKKLDSYHRNRDKIETLPPFQSFYLDDLIGFANAQGNSFSEDVIELRNMVMHAHELVNKQDWNADNFIFDFASFERFFRRSLTLHGDFRKVENKTAFLQGLDGSISYE
ncbi:MAG: hypothetical protein R3C62_23015 [Chloroflexota bacterium]